VIERHDVDRDHAAKSVEVLSGQLGFWLDQIEEHPETLYNVYSRAISPEMFIPAIDGTDPDQARITPPDAMLQVVYPPILMFYQVLRRDADKTPH